ncbi:MAG TPA: preprotein translocase subunit SecG [Polyangiaceae bacterium]|jgi:preprotein translocase subunit SecG|nr:preprotein translocase subunit SecG [Polyangiaceae bacterium]
MLEILETPVTALHIFAASILILIILIQPGKSGGLTAALGGAGTQQVFGGRGAGNFLSRGTWVLAGTFFMTSIVLAYMSSSTDDSISDKRHKTHHAVSAPKKTPPAKK